MMCSTQSNDQFSLDFSGWNAPLSAHAASPARCPIGHGSIPLSLPSFFFLRLSFLFFLRQVMRRCSRLRPPPLMPRVRRTLRATVDRVSPSPSSLPRSLPQDPSGGDWRARAPAASQQRLAPARDAVVVGAAADAAVVQLGAGDDHGREDAAPSLRAGGERTSGERGPCPAPLRAKASWRTRLRPAAPCHPLISSLHSARTARRAQSCRTPYSRRPLAPHRAPQPRRKRPVAQRRRFAWRRFKKFVLQLGTEGERGDGGGVEHSSCWCAAASSAWGTSACSTHSSCTRPPSWP